MGFFVASYDIKEENSSAELIDALKELDSVHTQKSVWLVASSRSAKGLFDHLRSHVQDNDRLMVVEFYERPKVQKGMSGTKDWLNRHFS